MPPKDSLNSVSAPLEINGKNTTIDNLIIRNMEEKDVKDVAKLASLSFSEPWSENAYLQTLSNPLYLSLVTYKDDEFLGFADVTSVCGEASLNNIAVKEEYRQKGVATSLINTLIDKLKENGIVSLTLEVRPSNTPAISLYKKIGFKVCGRRRDFYKKPTEDALILTIAI